MHYIAFIHQDKSGFGVSFPDFPGCVSHGDSLDAAMKNGREALAFHFEGLQDDGLDIPAPRDSASIAADAGLAEWREDATLAYIPLLIDRGSPRRVNVSLDSGLLAAIDAAAHDRGMNRSAFLASAARKEIGGDW